MIIFCQEGIDMTSFMYQRTNNWTCCCSPPQDDFAEEDDEESTFTLTALAEALPEAVTA